MRALGSKFNRQERTRKKVRNLENMPRISVFRSNKYLTAQLIDDSKKTTIASVGKKDIKEASGQTKTQSAKDLGLALASLAKKKKIERAVFDKGRYAYHGRVKSFAEGLREGGIKI